jgi:NADPH-dependent 2,4-dienoyl-CoA reductase/sulfur reductase-like enzyme
MEKVVVVGAGHAGVELANALRGRPSPGRSSRQRRDRPTYRNRRCRKNFLKATAHPRAEAEVFYAQRASPDARRRVVGIDRAAKTVWLDGGQALATITSPRSAPATASSHRADHPDILGSGPSRTRGASRGCRRFGAWRSSAAASSGWRSRRLLRGKAIESTSSRWPIA